MTSKAEKLDAELIALHGSTANARLSQLHESAANLLATTAAMRFHLSQAWVYALVAGDSARVADLETRLRRLNAL